MSKSIDTLKQKELELNALVGQSDAAVFTITNTIAKLENVNKNIESKMVEIDEYQEHLAGIKKGLTETRDKNENIMKKFNALLGH